MPGEATSTRQHEEGKGESLDRQSKSQVEIDEDGATVVTDPGALEFKSGSVDEMASIASNAQGDGNDVDTVPNVRTGKHTPLHSPHPSE
jgi:hypothetical protein